MSDSEDDFMSDKFLVDVPKESTYSARRSKAQLSGMRKGQAHNARNLPLKELEKERRREGLNTSLFDASSSSASAPKDAGKDKAMDFMRKMGWTPGESLGRRRSASPDMKKRAEPIRVSMWAGRKGLSARSPSPPPLKRLAPDEISEEARARLETEATSFRGRRGADFAARDVERKENKARKILIEQDEKNGVKFHPLHALPGNPMALPRPLLIRIYPELDTARSRSPSPVADTPAPSVPSVGDIVATARNVSAAEKLREQMRREMLAELGAEEDEVSFAAPKIDKEETKEEEADVDWDEMVSGTKRVLAMTPEEHLAYLISQLRNEHLFCFWCASKYSSWEELEGPGGCPGEDEDDH